MNHVVIWKFWKFPRPILFFTTLASVALISLVSNYWQHSTVESGPVTAFILFIIVIFVLLFFRTTITLKSEPFLFQISQSFRKDKILKLENKSKFGFSLDPNTSEIAFYSVEGSEFTEIHRVQCLFKFQAAKKRLQIIESLGLAIPQTFPEEYKANRLRSHTPWVSGFLIALNVLVILALGLMQAMHLNWSVDLALNNAAIERQEYWKLVSYFFMHAGLLHLSFNMVALYDLGHKIEAYMGSWKFLGFYFISGIASGAYALLWLEERSLVGASGAIYALLGFTLYLTRKKENLFYLEKLSKIDLFLCLMISLLPGVSFAAHFGGLAIGVLFGYFYSNRSHREIKI